MIGCRCLRRCEYDHRQKRDNGGDTVIVYEEKKRGSSGGRYSP